MSHLVLVLACVAVTVVYSQAMVGGPTSQDASDPAYLLCENLKERAWRAMKGVNDNASNNGPYHYMPIKVLNATSQVVAGVKYNFDVLVGQSTCKKGDLASTEVSSANCNLKEGGSRAIYKVTLWEKPWENFQQFNVEKERDVGADEQF